MRVMAAARLRMTSFLLLKSTQKQGRPTMRQLAFSLLTVLMPASVLSAQTANWPQFRGAHSDGLGDGDTLPDTWSTTENVVWKADIPGWGWSSPVIWGNRIFVTSAVSEHE